MSEKCPKCKEGYLELELNEEEASCTMCNYAIEAKVIEEEE